MPSMLFMASADWTEQYATVGERLFLGFTMMLVGVAIVFIMLLLISWAIRVIPLFLKKKKPDQISAPASRQASPLPVHVPEPSVREDDPQLVAVIMAALSAALTEHAGAAASGIPGAGFRVRRIRRIG